MLKSSIRRQELWNERKQKGLCVYCGNRKAKDGCIGCPPCLEKKYAATKKCSTPDKQRKYRESVRKEVLKKYGNECECCGVTQPEYLTIDHKLSNGGEERKRLYGSQKGSAVRWYLKLKREPVRDDLRVLCYNCNHAFANYGYSPACCSRK